MKFLIIISCQHKWKAASGRRASIMVHQIQSEMRRGPSHKSRWQVSMFLLLIPCLIAMIGGVMFISKNVLNSINASSHATQFPANMGGGYIASFEIVHQLHCIQFIREWTYRDYYQNKSVIFTDSEKTIRNRLANPSPEQPRKAWKLNCFRSM